MKKAIFQLIIMTCFVAACSSARKSASDSEGAKLSGNWELTFISGQGTAFEVLYPDKKPTISFDQANTMVNGNTSCNNFNGPIQLDGNQIRFPGPLQMTRMACIHGNGESVFLEALNRVTNYRSSSDGNTLQLKVRENTLMRFTKK